MSVNEIHMCIFCERKMTNTYCKPCDTYKGYKHYVFERVYKGKTYRFEYDISEQKFTLLDDNANYGKEIIMQSDDLYLIRRTDFGG